MQKTQTLLQRKYEELKAKNRSFSMRAYARVLKVGSGPLSEILSGKRPITDKMMRKWIESRIFDPVERMDLAREAGYILTDSSATKSRGARQNEKYIKISKQQMQVIAEWWHFAILSLMKTNDFESDPAWIAHRLGISLDTAKAAIERLASLNLIARAINGRWLRTSEAVRTPDDLLDLAIQRSHSGLMNLAQRKLKEVSPDKRDYTSFIMASRPDRLPEAKARIRKFQDDLSELLEESPQTEVYQLGIQLFPLTK